MNGNDGTIDGVIRNVVTERGGEPYREIDVEDPEGAISEMGWRIDESTPSIIAACRAVVERRSAAEVDGVLIDVQTAHAIVTVYDSLSPHNRQTLMKRWGTDVYRLGDFCWKLIGRVREKQT